MSSWRRALCVALIGLAGGTGAARGQQSATVALDDPSYFAIDELAASIPVRGLVVGQRPYSRRDIARIAVAFERELSRTPRTNDREVPRLNALVRSLLDTYANEVRAVASRASDSRVSFTEGARIDVIATNSAPRPVPPSNGLGTIVAVTNPLTDDQSGRPVAHGYTGALELSGAMGVGSWLAFEANPRLTSLSDRDGSTHLDARFQRLYARAVAGDLAIQLGTDDRIWGVGNASGMLLSANPRPLPSLAIGTDTPFTLPWFFSRLGPMRATFMVANLGDTQNFPGAKLVGYKIDVMPTPHLSLGMGLIDQMGGGGAPPLSFVDRVKDLFPYVFLAANPGSDRQASNKIAAVSVRYAFSGIHGASLYYELDPDDFDVRRLGSIYTQDSGHLLGLHVERLAGDNPLGVDLQFHRTSLRLYEHGQFASGVTYRGAIIGDPLGPNAVGAYPTLFYRFPGGRTLTLAAAYESRDSSRYTVFQDDTLTGRGWRFVKLAEGVRERRARLSISARRAALVRVDVEPLVGIERVFNAGFTQASDATYLLAELSVRFRF